MSTTLANVNCRTCLENNVSLTSIFESKAAEMLNYCNFCEIRENDGFSSQICYSCLKILEQSYAFKQQCKNTEMRLKKIQMKLAVTDENFTDFADHDLETDDVCKNQPFGVTAEDLISFLDQPLPPPLQFPCGQCAQSFDNPSDLKVHQSVHGTDLVCLICFKKFTGRQVLKRHLKIHFLKKSHLCKICGKTFAESHALTKHLRHHSGVPREKKHICEECGQSFSEPYYLNIHLRKHTGERPLVCQQCNKTFADPRSFKIHLMVHNGEKPFECRFCQKQFAQNANLKKHSRIHTGEKPYSCTVCNKKFTQSSSLGKHVRTHSKLNCNNSVKTA